MGIVEEKLEGCQGWLKMDGASAREGGWKTGLAEEECPRRCQRDGESGGLRMMMGGVRLGLGRTRELR